MNGHDYEGLAAYGPQDDDERRRAQEEDMWLDYEAMCAERDARLVDEHGPGVLVVSYEIEYRRALMGYDDAEDEQ